MKDENEYLSKRLPPRHLLCHGQHQSPVTLFHFAEQATKLHKQSRFFARTSSSDVVGRLALRELWQLFVVVEKLLHRNFQGAGELFKRLARSCTKSASAEIDENKLTGFQPERLTLIPQKLVMDKQFKRRKFFDPLKKQKKGKSSSVPFSVLPTNSNPSVEPIESSMSSMTIEA